MALQAAQVRKSNYVPEKRVDYDPDKHSVCTVYQGTIIQQVAFAPPPPPTPAPTLLTSFNAVGVAGMLYAIQAHRVVSPRLFACARII